MSDEKASRQQLAYSYLLKAEQDLFALRHLIRTPGVADEIIGFHAQQSTEKALKALLTWRGIAFRRTHNVGELLSLLVDHGVEPPSHVKATDILTPFAVTFRYDVLPDDEPPVNQKQFLRLAEGVCAWVKSAMAGK